MGPDPFSFNFSTEQLRQPVRLMESDPTPSHMRLAMPIIRKSQTDIWPARCDYHVLTYAEEGFAPLNIHAASFGIEKRQLAAFVDSVN